MVCFCCRLCLRSTSLFICRLQGTFTLSCYHVMSIALERGILQTWHCLSTNEAAVFNLRQTDVIRQWLVTSSTAVVLFDHTSAGHLRRRLRLSVVVVRSTHSRSGKRRYLSGAIVGGLSVFSPLRRTPLLKKLYILHAIDSRISESAQCLKAAERLH